MSQYFKRHHALVCRSSNLDGNRLHVLVVDVTGVGWATAVSSTRFHVQGAWYACFKEVSISMTW